MPKCRFCGESITKFDKDICPFCGEKKPLEGVDNATIDITQFIETLPEDQKDIKFKQHKKIINILLCMFLGYFSADLFYIGFVKYGFIRLAINVSMNIVAAITLYFSINELGILWAILYPFFGVVIVYFINAIILLFSKDRKDAHGVLLK